MLPSALRTLIILRHGKAHPEDEGPDKARELTGKGRKAVHHVGELARARGLVPDIVLCSTAVRARQTLEVFSEACELSGRVEFLDALYLAPASAYVAEARKLGGDARKLMVVGHNPGLEALLEALTGSSEALPTGGLAECELSIQAWSELNGEECGSLRGLWKPKEIA